MEKKNKGLIVLVIILTVLVLCLGGYIVYDKLLGTDNNDNANDVTDSSDVINETVVFNAGENKKYNKNVGNHIVNADDRTLIVDNNILFKLEDINFLHQVTFYKDIIITFQSVGTSGMILIYDYDGNIIKSIDKFKDNYERLFYTSSRYSNTEYFNVSSDGKILFVGSKHLQLAAGTYLTDNDTEINLLGGDEDINSLYKENNIDDNSIVSGIFEFSYLGNYSFGDIKYVSTNSTIKDLINS